MRLTYNTRRNIAYLRLRAPGTDVETIKLSEEVAIDMAADGSVAGIEFLNTNEQLRAGGDGGFVVVDESIGRLVTVPLTAV